MKFRSQGMLFAAPLAALALLSGCDSSRPVPTSAVETIEIPAADVDNQQNTNIDDPTLEIPVTFPVGDGDLLTLVWSDEFNGDSLDPEVWFYESGDGTQYGIPFPAFGNNELQYYLPDNVQLGDGKLQITARRESAEGYNVTSGRIMTRDRFAFTYGRIEASIKLPPGQGTWPAFWMLSQADEPNAAPGFGTYGVYAQSGEIDIVEAVNLKGTPGPGGTGGGNQIFSTIHFGGDSSINQNLSVETRYTPSEDVTTQFHTYAFEWDQFEMRWYFNGILYKVENSWSSTGGPFPAPFDKPFYVLFNLAVGGNFPGPLGADALPATLEVDWVRVYTGQEPDVDPADPGILPDVVIYATDQSVAPDLVFGVDYTGFDPFGSGSTFNGTNSTDTSFVPAFGVTTGNGYGAQVGQFAIVGFAAGFASGYESLVFKAKNLNNDLIRVKLLPSDPYIDIDLTSSSYSTPLGDDWYQVVVPIADFTDVATATAILWETDNTAPAPFTFLLTDFGFNEGSGGGTPPPVGGTELITNGGFESGDLPPWGDFSGGGSVTVVNTEASEGTFSVNLVAGESQTAFLRQADLGAGTVSDGDTLTVSFDLKGSLAEVPVLVEVQGAGVVRTITSGDITSDWQRITVDATIAGDFPAGVFLQLGTPCGPVATCSADVFIDNVSVTAP